MLESLTTKDVSGALMTNSKWSHQWVPNPPRFCSFWQNRAPYAQLQATYVLQSLWQRLLMSHPHGLYPCMPAFPAAVPGGPRAQRLAPTAEHTVGRSGAGDERPSLASSSHPIRMGSHFPAPSVVNSQVHILHWLPDLLSEMECQLSHIYWLPS